jgi:hypothetical protein
MLGAVLAPDKESFQVDDCVVGAVDSNLACKNNMMTNKNTTLGFVKCNISSLKTFSTSEACNMYFAFSETSTLKTTFNDKKCYITANDVSMSSPETIFDCEETLIEIKYNSEITSQKFNITSVGCSVILDDCVMSSQDTNMLGDNYELINVSRSQLNSEKFNINNTAIRYLYFDEVVMSCTKINLYAYMNEAYFNRTQFIADSFSIIGHSAGSPSILKFCNSIFIKKANIDGFAKLHFKDHEY